MNLMWEYSLSKVFETDDYYNRHSKPVIIVSRDNPNTKGKQFAIIHYNKTNVRKILQHDFHGYEILYNDLPRKFYVDIDLKPESPLFKRVTTEQLVDIVISTLTSIFNHAFPRHRHLLLEPKVFISNSDTQNIKKSAHIIFPNFIILNQEDTVILKHVLKAYLENDNIPLSDSENGQYFTIPYPEVKIENLIDLNVYGSNQNFRFPFHSKFGKNNTLIPVLKLSPCDCMVGIYTNVNQGSLLNKYLIEIEKKICQDLYIQKFRKKTCDKVTRLSSYGFDIFSDLIKYEDLETSEINYKTNDIIEFYLSCIPNEGKGQSWNVWWAIGQALQNIGVKQNDKDKYFNSWVNWTSRASHLYPNYKQSCTIQWNNNKVRHENQPRFQERFLESVAAWYFPHEVEDVRNDKGIGSLFELNEKDKTVFNKVDVYNGVSINDNQQTLTSIWAKELNVKKAFCKTYDLDKNDIVVSQAPMGSGKTYQIMKLLRNKREYQRVLVLSSRQTFSKEKHAEFKKICPDFKHYQENLVNGTDDWTSFNRFIVQVESLARFPDIDSESRGGNFYYDLVVLDEIESVLYQFSSTTHKDIQKSFSIFNHIIQHSKKIIMADAFITKRTSTLCKAIMKRGGEKNERKIVLDINTSNPNSETCAKIIGIARLAGDVKVNKEKFVEKLCCELKKGKKICVVNASKNFKNIIIDEIIRAGILEKENILGYDGESADADIQKLENVRELWSDPIVKLVIYTTKITIGINYDVRDVFDSIFIYGSVKCPNVRDLMQGHFRVRHTKEKTVYIALNCFNPGGMYGIDEVNQRKTRAYLAKIQNNFDPYFGDDTEGAPCGDPDSLYHNIATLNYLEDLLGYTNYEKLFMYFLTKIGYRIEYSGDECPKKNLSHSTKENDIFPLGYVKEYQKYKKCEVIEIRESRKKRGCATYEDKKIINAYYFNKNRIENTIDLSKFDDIFSIKLEQGGDEISRLKARSEELNQSLLQTWESDLFYLYNSNCEMKKHIDNTVIEMRTQSISDGISKAKYTVVEKKEFAVRLKHIINTCRILNMKSSFDESAKITDIELQNFRLYLKDPSNSEITRLFGLRNQKTDSLANMITMIGNIFKYWNGGTLSRQCQRKMKKGVRERQNYECVFKHNHHNNIYYTVFMNLLMDFRSDGPCMCFYD